MKVVPHISSLQHAKGTGNTMNQKRVYGITTADLNTRIMQR
jgi:hypothetical protein